tara:strand:+ start:1838 stop:2845 length:1008 start_codon:yes stop_codon:yes gene_type:complete
MSDKDEVVDETTTMYDVMPGADKPDEDGPALDLSFAEVEAAITKEVEEEEEVEEEVEEEAETVSEDEQSTEEETDAEKEEEVEEEEVEEAVEELKPKKSPMVPKARLDEVLAKQKALQKQLDEVNAANEKSAEAPDTYDFDSKETEYQSMVLDGETDKAVSLRREIRKAERAELEFEMRQEMSQTVQQDRQMTALQQAATAMEEAYPEFNRDSESFNEDMTNEVVELRDAFIIKGYEAVDALSKAVNFVVKDNALDAPEPDGSALAAKAKTVDEMAKKRAQVSKKLQAAEAQPPELPGESSSRGGEKGLDLASMTEDEFNALPEATLKRLRGDII